VKIAAIPDAFEPLIQEYAATPSSMREATP
jgi:hypothetical protein